MVNPRVLTYDKLVSLAQLKVHSTATVTLAIKNMAMSYRLPTSTVIRGSVKSCTRTTYTSTSRHFLLEC
jgi:hypothetical protein